MGAFDELVAFVAQRGGEAHLPPNDFSAAIGALNRVFPPDWMGRRGFPRNLTDREPRTVHPIGELLRPAGAQATVSLLELGGYLAALSEVPGLATVEHALRAGGNDYYHALLQLAFAFRVAVTGGLEGLAFEPPAKNGRQGDFKAVWRHLPYQAECYRPSTPSSTTPEMEVMERRLGDMASAAEMPLDILVHLTALPTAADRKLVVSCIRNGIEEIKREMNLGLLDKGVRHLELPSVARLELRLTEAAADETNDGTLLETPTFNPHVLASIRSGRRVKRIAGSEPEGMSRVERGPLWRVGIVPPPMPGGAGILSGAGIDAALDKLAGTLEGKLAQARNYDGAARLLICESPLARHVATHGGRRKRLARRLFRGRADLAAVLSVAREWRTESARWRYAIAPAVHTEGAAPYSGLVNALLRLEKRADWL